ncbi:C1QL [Mytilus coruscus]|uniref:C1QL n=1 Tax=Mytilus coruscus TaxID=42192 RepID=A0A6J8EYR0_MYTCO|nr:C1QL [Mytilus coruscus]
MTAFYTAGVYQLKKQHNDHSIVHSDPRYISLQIQALNLVFITSLYHLHHLTQVMGLIVHIFAAIFALNFLGRPALQLEQSVLDLFPEFTRLKQDIKSELASIKSKLQSKKCSNFFKNVDKIRELHFMQKLQPRIEVMVPSKTVVFDYVITNIGSAYNNRNGHFTAPYDGVYFFVATFHSIRIYNSYGLHLQMVKNNYVLSEASAGASSDGSSMNAIVSLKRGDVIKIRNNPIRRGTFKEGMTFFSGYLVY